MGYLCYLCGKKANKNIGLSLHQFPKSKSSLMEKVLSQWLTVCSLTKDDDISGLRICSNHFRETDYLSKYRLNATAVPSVNIRLPKKRKYSESRIVTESGLTSSISSIDQDSAKENNEGTKQWTEAEEEIVLERSSTPENDPQQFMMPPKRRCLSEPQYVSEILISHVCTPRRGSRILAFVKDVINKKSRRIKQLQDVNRKLHNKIRNLEEMMAKLQRQKLVSEEAEDTLMVDTRNRREN